MERLTIEDIDARDFTAADISGVLSYWYRSPPHHLAALGVSPEELPSEDLMREMLEINVAKSGLSPISRQAILSIKLRDETIGVHELTHIVPPTSGIMHAHIWNGSHRGMGIGLVSYVKAMHIFFDRFGLEQICFETPIGNIAAQKVKSRLGIVAHGRGSITLPILKRPLETISYRVLRSQMPELDRAMRAEWQRRWPSREIPPHRLAQHSPDLVARAHVDRE
jgi:RimJ/RimL family protein N-acetyltransferase